MAAEASTSTESPPDLLAAAFALIAEQGWQRLSLRALAEHAGVPPVEVYRALPGRDAILAGLSRRVDEAMLGVPPGELDDLPPRDRVFELIMRRLDALAALRPGVVRLMRDARGDPLVWLVTACRLDRSMAWLQDLAGLRRHGLRARLQRRLLGAVYLQTLRVWLADETADMAKTMSELDKQLRRIESMAGLAGRRARAASPGPEPQAA
jgi:AcrR family transcriptional regulator